MIEILKKLFQKRELGDKIILVNDIVGTSPFGDNTLFPKGTICLNNGMPNPEEKYGKTYIELKLIHPIIDGLHVTDRLVVKQNSKDIATYNAT